MKLVVEWGEAEITPKGEDWEALWKRAGEAVLSREKIPSDAIEVSLSMVSGEEIRDLNREYRGKDAMTDVLSFPQFDDINAVRDAATKKSEDSEKPQILLGDVVICMEKARAQAEECGHSQKRELTYLFVHSILHLLGYDHLTTEDKKVMRDEEKTIMNEIDLQRQEQ